MSRNYDYYDKEKAMVKLAHALGARGWKVYGYKADESDSMTDYWSPASCDGIYEKNGFLLCVNTSDYTVKNYSGKEQYKYNYGFSNGLSFEDKKRIEKLEAMTQERGASAGEEENAKRMIDKIKSNCQNDKQEKELLYVYPVFQANPTRCTWHIEKENAIYEKGNNIYKFADLPYEYDERTGKIDNNYYRNKSELTADEKKLVNEFQAFILKLERIVNNMNTMGDGTKETEEKAKEQESVSKMVKITVTETKKVIKPIQIDRKTVKVGDLLKVNRYSCYWKVISINEELKTFTYEQVGKRYQDLKNGKRYYDYFKNLDKEGRYTICELKEVEEVSEVEKWVKAEEIHKNNKSNNNKNEKVNNDNNSEAQTDSEQATSKQLWALHCATKLDTRELKISKSRASELITASKNGENITDIIKTMLEGKTPEQQQKNESIVLNYDEIEVTEEDKNNMETLLDYSCNIMTDLNMGYYDIFTNQEYKARLIEVLKNKVKLTKGLLKALHSEYMSFEGYILTLLNSKQVNFYNDNNSNSNSKQNIVTDYSKLIEKINNQIDSNNKKIEHLSGDYKTNTWKRMNEQANRDRQRNSLEYDNRILNYLLDRIDNNTITELEKCLTVSTFRNDIDLYCNRHFVEKKPTSWIEIEFPTIRPEWGLDNWYNKEVPKKQKRLNKANIFNTSDLIKAVEEYKTIIDFIECNSKVDKKQEQIKKLERELKMTQKGDINFTTNKELLNRLMELAEIEEDDEVLEPSAGIGSICDIVKQYTSNIDTCEYMYSYAELLKLKGYNVLENDFLQLNKYNGYSKIVMNPPFSAEQQHIKHAYNMLKDGGKLVSVTSNSWTFRSDKQTQEFRNWLDNLTYEVYDVEQGMFEFTNVSCKILVIYKDEETKQQAV